MLITKWWFWLIIIVLLVISPTIVSFIGQIFKWIGTALDWLANLAGFLNFLR